MYSGLVRANINDQYFILAVPSCIEDERVKSRGDAPVVGVEMIAQISTVPVISETLYTRNS